MIIRLGPRNYGFVLSKVLPLELGNDPGGLPSGLNRVMYEFVTSAADLHRDSAQQQQSTWSIGADQAP